MLSFIIWIPIIAVMIYAAYTDSKWGEVPIVLFIALVPVVLLLRQFVCNELPVLSLVLGGGAAFIGFLLMAVCSDGGGGDIIMMTSLGFCFGFRNISLIVVISSLILLISMIAKKCGKHDQCAYAPPVLIATVCMAAISLAEALV